MPRAPDTDTTALTDLCLQSLSTGAGGLTSCPVGSRWESLGAQTCLSRLPVCCQILLKDVLGRAAALEEDKGGREGGHRVMALGPSCGASTSVSQEAYVSFLSRRPQYHPEWPSDHLSLSTLTYVPWGCESGRPTAGHNSVTLTLYQTQGVCFDLRMRTTLEGEMHFPSASGLNKQTSSLRETPSSCPCVNQRSKLHSPGS